MYIFDYNFKNLKRIMKNCLNYLIIGAFSITLFGCASVYKPIEPQYQNYMAHELTDGISLSYKYDVLQEAGNKKNAKKEDKNEVRVIAVKITNNTDSTICIGKNAAFYSGYNQLAPLSPKAIKEQIGQSPASHLLYLLLMPMNLYTTKQSDTGTETKSYPIGLIVGPGIAIGNMVVASNSNSNMEIELIKNDVIGRDIQKGETIYGIVAFKGVGYLPLSIKKIKTSPL